MKKTLLIDSSRETGLFHTFLLSLAGHLVTEVRSPVDALGRIIGAKGTPAPFQLLVISHFHPAIPFGTFIDSLRDAGCTLPVLVFLRPGNPAPIPLPGVAWCLPDDALEAVSAPHPHTLPTPPPIRDPGTGRIPDLSLHP